jgi:large-conductance mechanosensitive channel
MMLLVKETAEFSYFLISKYPQLVFHVPVAFLIFSVAIVKERKKKNKPSKKPKKQKRSSELENALNTKEALLEKLRAKITALQGLYHSQEI